MQVEANDVIDRLTAKVAELVKDLAISEALVEAYQKREQQRVEEAMSDDT